MFCDFYTSEFLIRIRIMNLRISFFGSISQRYRSKIPDPDVYHNGTDTQHW
jgi:hypothetical protein